MVEEIFKKIVHSRAEKSPYTFLFDYTDFEGLNKRERDFEVNGNVLKGAFYYYDSPKKGKLVVFDHGMWSGRRNYMKEIEKLARGGYLVYSYDHTGCMESEGEGTNGFAQSLCDLDHAIRMLKDTEELKDYEISVVGHSWGGFSTMNICALHPDIKNVVTISGFVSVKQIVYQSFSGILRPFAKKIYDSECKCNPSYAYISGENSLKDTKASVLVIYSTNDKTVRNKYNSAILEGALSEKENVRFLPVEGRDHNPTYTKEAVSLLNKYLRARKKAIKKKLHLRDGECEKFVSMWDFDKMTEQDEAVWKEIYKALER